MCPNLLHFLSVSNIQHCFCVFLYTMLKLGWILGCFFFYVFEHLRLTLILLCAIPVIYVEGIITEFHFGGSRSL